MTFKMKGSPIRGKKEDKAKHKTYIKTRESVTANMSDKQLRDMTVAQHGGRANKWNVSYNELKKLRDKALKSSSESKETTKVTEVTESDKMSMGQFSWYGQSGITDPRLTRDETYADYAYSVDKDVHPKGLLKSSAVEKKSPYKKGLGSYAKKAKGSRGYKMNRK